MLKITSHKMQSSTILEYCCTKIIQAARKGSTQIWFYGRMPKDGERRFDGSTPSHRIYTGDSSGQSLCKILEHLRAEQSNDQTLERGLAGIETVWFDDFQFEMLPSNLQVGSVLPNVLWVSLHNCPRLSNLQTIFEQFLSIQKLMCHDCHALTSLSSLSAIMPTTPIRRLYFDCCGLHITKNDDWDAGMRALAQVRNISDFSLVLRFNSNLETIPSSIAHLKDLQCPVELRLISNRKLKSIPHCMGDILNLKRLDLVQCPFIETLPFSLGRVSEDCMISMDKSNEKRITELKESVKDIEQREWRSRCGYELQVKDLDCYFQEKRRTFIRGVLKLRKYLDQAEQRAITRYYSPDGKGFVVAKNEFEKLSSPKNLHLE